MSISLQWLDDEQTVLYMRHDGESDFEEYQQLADLGLGYARESLHNVSLIVHIVEPLYRMMPPHDFRHWRYKLLGTPANIDNIVFIPDMPVIRGVITCLNQFVNRRNLKLYAAPNLDAAQQMLIKRQAIAAQALENRCIDLGA